jgi:hypothetical protein
MVEEAQSLELGAGASPPGHHPNNRALIMVSDPANVLGSD